MSDDLSAAECQERIEQFSQITQCDEALAQFYLQDRNWNVETSIAAFFEENKPARKEKISSSKRQLHISDSLASFLSTVVPDNYSNAKRKSETLHPLEKQKIARIEKVLPENFSFVSWNVDGLDSRNIKERTMAVIKTIKTRNVDIVFLQEVVSQTYEILKSHLSSDYLFTENKTPTGFDDQFYFTVVLLKRSTLNLESVVIKPFFNSKMCRDLTLVKAKFQNETRLLLINTHLESTKDFAASRMEQLKQAFKLVKEEDKNWTVILAGDLNARDSEVDKVGIPAGVKDLWISLGKRKECEYTWDTMRNTNVQMGGKFKPRCRFDRVYFRPSAFNDITPEHFGLCGIEKVSGMQCFPSDHWGLYCIFDLNKVAVEKKP